jgi:hypothetical protein
MISQSTRLQNKRHLQQRKLRVHWGEERHKGGNVYNTIMKTILTNIKEQESRVESEVSGGVKGETPSVTERK